MARRATLRASDQDREHVAERLRQAAAEGRLLAEELEHRLARALRARTYAELDPLVADLPRGAVAKRRSLPPVATVAVTAAVAVVVVAAVAIVAMVIAGLLAAWAVWAFIAWWFFGQARHHRHRPRRHRAHVRVVHRRSLL